MAGANASQTRDPRGSDSRAADAPLRGTVSGTRFSIPSLGPGSYVVSAYTEAQVASARVQVRPGAATPVTLAGGGSGSVAGRVRDFHRGAPVEGVRCTAHARVGDARTSGWIGVDAVSDRAGAFDLDPQSLVPRLYRVLPRGPAGAAGLVEGDVIVAVDGTSVTELSPRAVWWLLIDRPPGTTVPVSARRGGRTLTVNLVIGPTDDP